jgi:hypothetical protein
MRQRPVFIVVAGLLAVSLGCGGGRPPAAVGAESSPCYVGHNCDDGLTCVSDVCVPGVADGGTKETAKRGRTAIGCT